MKIGTFLSDGRAECTSVLQCADLSGKRRVVYLSAFVSLLHHRSSHNDTGDRHRLHRLTLCFHFRAALCRVERWLWEFLSQHIHRLDRVSSCSISCVLWLPAEESTNEGKGTESQTRLRWSEPLSEWTSRDLVRPRCPEEHRLEDRICREYKCNRRESIREHLLFNKPSHQFCHETEVRLPKVFHGDQTWVGQHSCHFAQILTFRIRSSDRERIRSIYVRLISR